MPGLKSYRVTHSYSRGSFFVLLSITNPELKQSAGLELGLGLGLGLGLWLKQSAEWFQ